MKYLAIKISLILLFVSVAFADAFLYYFTAQSEGENVKIEWKTGEEANVNHFSIQRKTPQTSFAEITIVQPKGSNSLYSYLDQSIYKTNDVVFTYRLIIVNNDMGTSSSPMVTVSPNISGIKRTWGSIKAMFR
jgi:hypothetical protein